MTMAIIDGLLVRVGDTAFIIPMAAVTECVEMPEPPRDEKGRSILRIRDELVPFLTLSHEFGFMAAESGDPRIVIVQVEGRRLGLVVDDVVGQRQAVVKALSTYHRSIPGLGGSTILGDGSVALILDAAALMRSVRSVERGAA
jgi:two-component system chemotaxis sensor kinase CheA